MTVASFVNGYVHSSFVISPELNDGYYGVLANFFRGHPMNLFGIGVGYAPPVNSNSGCSSGFIGFLNEDQLVWLKATQNILAPGFPVVTTYDWFSVWQPSSVYSSSLTNLTASGTSKLTQAVNLAALDAGAFTADRILVDGVAGVNRGEVFYDAGVTPNPAGVTDPSAVGGAVVDASAAPTTTVTTAQGATGTMTSVASSTTSVTILAFNPNRLSASIYNDSTQVLYLLALNTVNSSPSQLFSMAASTTHFTVQLAAGGYYELPFNPIGAVYGIWPSANGFARVTEIAS